MKAFKFQVSIFISFIITLLVFNHIFAGTVTKLSNIFTLDTRKEELPPVDGWQILTNKGDSYNEDLIIDDHGKVWCFYFRSPGANQPVYLKIFKSDGYVYKSEQVVGYSSSNAEAKYNSLRAAENDSTGDVWVAIQGSQGGYFVIFDSTGTLKQDSTIIDKSAFSPKIASGKNGRMWFSWHNQIDGGAESQGKIACYAASGEIHLGSNTIGRHAYVFNTDIAVDDSNRIWTVFEINDNGDYATKFSIFNSDLSLYRDGMIISNNPVTLNPQRQIFSDVINQKVWILEKNTTIAQQKIHLYKLDGSIINTIENVGDCSFVRNQNNFLEVIDFNDQNNENKIYEYSQYFSQNGNLYSQRMMKFEQTFHFVRNGIAHNHNYPTLKAYAVQYDSNQTKIKFENVTPGSPAIAVKSISFDTTKISATHKKQRNINVQNNGKAILEVYDINPNNPQITVSDTAFTVLPGQSHALVVEFKPVTDDSLVDHIVFISNDPINDSLKVTVSGKGYLQTNPIITVDQDSLVFESIILGNAQTKRIFVYNDDQYEPLRIYSITTNNHQFSTPDSAGLTLLPKKGDWISVIFKPTEEGLVKGFLTINSNDTSNANLQIPLRGTGIRFGTPKIVISPQSLNFGEVALGHQKSLYCSIENKGETNLEIYSITSADTQFTANRNNFIIPPYSKYYVWITYQAKRLGEVNTNITINNSDPSTPNYKLPVSGTSREAKPAAIVISPDMLNFGRIAIGNSKTAYFWISNTGEVPLEVNSIQSNDKRYVVYQNSFIVNPGYPRSVAVRFFPDEPDTINGMLTIVSTSVTTDTAYLYLTGIGRYLTAPQMVLNPTRIEFGTVATTRSSTRTFTIHNSGEQLLEVSKIEFSELNPSYSIYPTSLTVPYGQYRTVYVTFSPQQTGLITGTINITSNDQSAQPISVTGTGRDPLPQNIYVNRGEVDFDSVAVSKSKSQYFWIKNDGELPLSILNISTSDSVFSTNMSSLRLNPGQSQYVLLTLTPTMIAAYRDSLVIQSDDPDSPYKYINLTGVGRLLRNQNIQLSSDSLSFGDIAISQQRSLGLTIYNTGEKELIISNISNTNSAFSSDDRDLVISPQSSRRTYVTFRPESLIVYFDTLKIASNDPNTPLTTVALQGSGRKLRDQQIAVFPDSLEFGNVGIGLVSNRNIQILNQGEVTLRIDSIKTNNQHFTIRSETAFSINPGLSSWISVQFQPDSVGKFEANLRIFSNDPDSSIYLVPLKGLGRELLEPNITFNPDDLNFGDVAVGRSKSIELLVGNSGEKELVVNSVVPDDNQFTADQASFSVSPGSSKLLNITFKPNVIDTVNTQLTVVSNDPDSSLAIVPLKGIGRALREPKLVYNPGELNFGQVLLGDSLSKNLVIQNQGDLPLQLFSITSFDSHFVTHVDSIVIDGGNSYQLRVTFSPGDTLEAQANLEIKSNDPNNYIFYIPLRGKGRAKVQQIVVSPANLDFEEVRIHFSAIQNIWVSNLGTKSLTISNIFSNNVHFRPQLSTFTLEQNENKKVPVSFTPDSLKSFSGKLSIISNDPVADSLVIPLKGIGRDSLDQQITVSIDSLYFGRVAINNRKTLYVKINNVGEKNLKIYNIISSNTVFTTNLAMVQIAPKSSQTLSVHFVPILAINYSDTLRIISNDPKNSTLLVKLSGIGRAPNPQKIVVSDTLLNFGTVPTDRTKSLSFKISNEGEKPLEISQFVLNNNQFSVGEKWLIINPGDKHYLTVVFSPKSAGLINGKLTIKSNDPQKSALEIRLTGIGVFYSGPKISIRPTSLDFGNTLIGIKKKLTLWIHNSSSDSILKINSFSVSNMAFAVSRTNLIVPRGDSAAVQVIFKPNIEGNHPARITIHSNDKYQSTFDFSTSGFGIFENVGQNVLAGLGWKDDGYTPVGNIFSPNPHTDSLLSDAPDRVWFIKDVFILNEPQSAVINLCFDDELLLFINGTFIFDSTATQPVHWNIENKNIKPYLRFGRNRISIMVWNKDNILGGFDCELKADGESKIKRGDLNWTNPDATWWYYGQMGLQYPTPPLDVPHNRLWFHSDYGLAGADSITAEWTFEPTGNDTIYDRSPYGYKAILNNITWIRGVIGQAMQFNGQQNCFVELQANLNNVPKTIEFWFNCYGQRQYTQNIITNKGAGQFGQGLFINPNMKLGVYFYNGEFILRNFNIDPNTWYFISTQYQSDRLLVYINNNLVADTSLVQGNPLGSNICYLGNNPIQQDTTAFYGAIDELKIKSTAITPTQMQQVARISTAPPDSTAKGEDVQLRFDIFPTPYKILSGQLEYTWGGSDLYRSKSLAIRDSIFNSPLEVVIPSDSITVRGLKYRINLETEYGAVVYPADGENYSWIEVTTAQETSAVTLPERIHRMVSVPYVLDNPSIDAVLVDNLDTEDPFRWRLFEWNQYNANYVAYTDSTWQRNSGFTPGNAFWLITSEPQVFDAGLGHSPANVSQQINLEPGWTMIGNPFPYPVNWDDIQVTSSLISDPLARAAIDSIGWIYTTTLNPWEGYFVWNGDNSTRSLIVPPKEATRRSMNKPYSLTHKYLSKYPDISILISANLRCGKFIDHDNLFGVSENATDGYDRYDLPEAPVIGDFVSMWIDNSNWEKSGGAYTVDIRKDGSEGYAWDVIVEYSIEKPEDFLNCKFNRLTELPDGWLMYLFDRTDDTAINLQEQPEISFNPVSGEQTGKPYKLVIGTEAFVQQNSDDIPLVPLEFELFQNYPNPFNAATTVRFNLPKRMHVSVEIYNILGQLVNTLVDEQLRGGHHAIHWDGKNNQGNLITTGLYIVRLQSRHKVAVKKMLLIK